ncbi:MAG: hypothetical protein STSR0009_28640 [Methanoregula sp.]|jgi:hypothetical protein|nr:hypothetical protein [Methanoregula sp.]
MIVTDLLTPLSIVIEFLVTIIGLYCGAVLRRPAGYFFAVTFLIFGMYDYLFMFGVGQDMLSFLNFVALLSALGGIIFLAKKA